MNQQKDINYNKFNNDDKQEGGMKTGEKGKANNNNQQKGA